MTEDLNVFPNARSKLFGEGEDSIGIIDTPAVAGLTGTAPAVAGATDGDGTIGTDTTQVFTNHTFSLLVADEVLDTLSVSVNNVDSVVVIAMNSEQGNRVGVIKVRNTTTGTDIATFNMTAASLSALYVITQILVVDSSPNAGTNNYDVIAVSGSLFRYAINIRVINVNDTHAGIISTPATATKQINTADSHRTHEQAVLPG